MKRIIKRITVLLLCVTLFLSDNAIRVYATEEIQTLAESVYDSHSNSIEEEYECIEESEEISEEILETGEEIQETVNEEALNALSAKMQEFINLSTHCDGAAWGNVTCKLNPSGIGNKNFAYQCAAYVADAVYYIYNKQSIRDGVRFYDMNEIRSGDVLYWKYQYYNEKNELCTAQHWFFVLDRSGNDLYVAEGNWDNGEKPVYKQVKISNGKYRIVNSTTLFCWTTNRTITEAYHMCNDDIAPTISDVKIQNLTSTGYDIVCTVNDNMNIDYVQFGAWSIKNGMDDQVWVKQPSHGNGTYTYRVNVSEHNYEEGEYATHIYAYDACGNYAFHNAVAVYVDRTAPVVSDIKIISSTSDSFTVNCKALDDKSNIEKVAFASWTSDNWWDDLDPDWDRKALGHKESDGTWSYEVKIPDHNNELGLYVTDIYAYDTCGNVSEYGRIWFDFTGKEEPKYTVPDGLKAYCGDLLSSVILPNGFSWTEAENTVVVAGHNSENSTKAIYKAKYTPKDTDKYAVVENIDITISVSHSPKSAVKENVVNPTCKTKGSYEKVVYCSCEDCKVEISREKIDTDMIDHIDENDDGICDACHVVAFRDGFWIKSVAEQTYTGAAITPSIVVYYRNKKLVANQDYTLKITNNKNVGNAVVTITGKGNYAGTEKESFAIVPRNINGSDFKGDSISVKATGKAQKPAPVLLWNGKAQSASSVYTYQYYKADGTGKPVGGALTSVTDAGNYVIELKGKGNFEGTRYISLVVTNDFKLINKMTFGKVANQTYTGSAIIPSVVVKEGKTELVEGRDYTVTYENNINVGVASVLVTGKGEYSGSKRINFNITGTALSKATVEGITSSVPYTGNDIFFDNIRLYIKATKTTAEKPFTKGNDYTVSYSNNQAAGTATVLFTGINGYTGTVKKTFKITPYKAVADDTRISVSVPESVEYSKGGAKPAVTVKFINSDGTVRTLTEKTDYTVAYQKNAAVNDCSNAKNMPTVKVTLKGSYSGTFSKNYVITPKNLSLSNIEAADKVYQGKSNGYSTSVSIIDTDGKKLAANKDYDKSLTYKYKKATVVMSNGTIVNRTAGAIVDKQDIIPAGTIIEVTATAKEGGNYTGTVSGEYRITQSSVASAKVTVPAQEYTGKPITISKENMTVKVGKDTLTADDFEIVEGSYQNNTNKGTASFTIRGKGNYGGTKKVTFSIKTKVFKWWWR